MDRNKWKPFHQTAGIVTTIQEYKQNCKHFNKRIRTYNASDNYYESHETRRGTHITPTHNKDASTTGNNTYAQVVSVPQISPAVNTTLPKFGVFQDVSVMKSSISTA
jgi:hypothetical protein